MSSWSTTPPKPTTDTAHVNRRQRATVGTGCPGRAAPGTATQLSRPPETAPADGAASPPSRRPPRKPPRPRLQAPAVPQTGDEVQVLRGAAAAVVKNMNASLDVPTATSVRAIPAKLMIDNRIVINNHLKRTRGGKISFTHLLGYAIVQAVKKFPNMNRHFAEVDGKPNAVTPAHTNLGPGHRPAGQGRQPSAGGGGHQELPRPCGSASSSPPTRTSCGAPATAS